MSDVTKDDVSTALKHLGFDSIEDFHYWATDNNELNRFDALTELLAAHRIAAIAAERERCAEMLEALRLAERALAVWVDDDDLAQIRAAIAAAEGE